MHTMRLHVLTHGCGEVGVKMRVHGDSEALGIMVVRILGVGNYDRVMVGKGVELVHCIRGWELAWEGENEGG